MLEELINYVKKVKGYKCVFMESGLFVCDFYIVEGDYMYDLGIEVVEKLLEEDEKLIVIFVGMDEMVLGVIYGV